MLEVGLEVPEETKSCPESEWLWGAPEKIPGCTACHPELATH